MRRAPEQTRYIGGGTISNETGRYGRTAMAVAHMSGAGARHRWVRSSRMPSVFMTRRATSGSGSRTAGIGHMRVRRPTVRLGKPPRVKTAPIVCSGALPGTALRVSCVPQATGPGTALALAPTS